MRVKCALSVILCVLGPAAADVGLTADPGTAFALRFGAGTQGIFSMFQAGVQLPRLGRNFGIGVAGRYLSSLTYATYIDSAGDWVSFHPCVVGGAVSMGGFGPCFHDMLRPYGNVELLLGYSFTPWDDFITHQGNLFGDNLTLFLSGVGGFELFTSRQVAFFIEGGGGYKGIRGDRSNRYVQTSSWLGSGVTVRVGVNVYR